MISSTSEGAGPAAALGAPEVGTEVALVVADRVVFIEFKVLAKVVALRALKELKEEEAAIEDEGSIRAGDSVVLEISDVRILLSLANANVLLSTCRLELEPVWNSSLGLVELSRASNIPVTVTGWAMFGVIVVTT